jgi:hypothetical protein
MGQDWYLDMHMKMEPSTTGPAVLEEIDRIIDNSEYRVDT